MADPQLVVALQAKLDKFEGQLKQAGVIADREVANMEDRFSRFNPGIATGIGTFLGALAGSAVTKAISSLETIFDRFKKIEETAKLAAISMNDVFGFQTSIKKSSFEDVDQALVTLSGLLDRAKRGEDNGLSKILGVNGVALGSIKDAGEALFKISDIISRLSPIRGLEVLQKLGLPTNLLDDLSKGEEHLRAMQKAAADAAPDLQAMAEKAKEFDKLWKAAVEAIKAYFIDGIGDLKKIIADFIDTTAKELRALEALGDGIRSAFGITGKTGLPGQAAESLEAIAGGLRAPAGEKLPRITVTGPKIDRPANPFPLADKENEGEDAFDRAIRQAEKRIAVLNAETSTIGLNSEARERAKVIATLEEAAKHANSQAGLENTEVTAKQREEIDRVAEAQYRAAAAARVANDALSKINNASSQLGSALSTAFADAVVEGKKLNEVFGSLIKTLEKAAINAVFASIFNAPTGGGLSPFAALFAPGRASGGSVTAGQPYTVGESGKELFVPNTSGRIIPNSVMKSGGGANYVDNRTFTFDASGADPASIARLYQLIGRVKAGTRAEALAALNEFSARGA